MNYCALRSVVCMACHFDEISRNLYNMVLNSLEEWKKICRCPFLPLMDYDCSYEYFVNHLDKYKFGGNLIAFFGHGDEFGHWKCQKYYNIFELDNCPKMAGNFLYSISCYTGNFLKSNWDKIGLLGFIGYEDEIDFPNNSAERYFEYFQKTLLCGLEHILRNDKTTIGDIATAIKEAYNSSIEKIFDAEYDDNTPMILWMLDTNYTRLLTIGDQSIVLSNE